MNQSDNKSPTETGQPMPLPCPFCGSPADVYELFGNQDGVAVRCSAPPRNDCPLGIATFELAQWNRRALPSPAPTMTPEPYSVPEAEDLLALFKLAAMDGYNPKPVGTVDDWVEEGKKRIFLLYLAGKRDSAPSPAPTPEAADG